MERNKQVKHGTAHEETVLVEFASTLGQGVTFIRPSVKDKLLYLNPATANYILGGRPDAIYGATSQAGDIRQERRWQRLGVTVVEAKARVHDMVGDSSIKPPEYDVLQLRVYCELVRVNLQSKRRFLRPFLYKDAVRGVLVEDFPGTTLGCPQRRTTILDPSSGGGWSAVHHGLEAAVARIRALTKDDIKRMILETNAVINH